MLRPEPMTRIVLVGSKEALEPTVTLLHDLHILHLVEYAEGEEPGFSIGSPLPAASAASQKLVKLRSLVRSLGLEERPPGTPVAAEEIERKLEQALVTLDLSVSTRAESRQRIMSLIREKEALIRAVEPFVPFDLPLEHLSGYDSLLVLAGTVRHSIANGLAELSPEAEVVEVSVSGGLGTLVFAPRELAPQVQRLLADAGFSESRIPEGSGLPEDAIAQARKDIESLQEDLGRVDEELEGIRKRFADFLLASEEHLSIDVERAETPLRLATTPHSFVIDGWIPARRFEELRSRLVEPVGKSIYLETLREAPKGAEEEHEEEAPVALRNPAPARPFEMLLGLFSTPQYREIDPTIFMFLVFPIFFGLMIGDLGYGLAFIGIGALMLVKIKRSEGLRELARIIILGGIFASLFGGLLFADAFGVPFHPETGEGGEGPTYSWESIVNLPIHATVHKLSDTGVKNLLVLSVLAALLHLGLGLSLGVRNELAHSRRHAAAKGAWLLVLFGLFLTLLAIGQWTDVGSWLVRNLFGGLMEPYVVIFGRSFPLIGLVLVGVGAVLIAVLEGAMAIMEILSLLANMISYTRLAAIGVAKGAMALAFNTIALPMVFESSNVGQIVGGALIAVVAHLIVFFLGGLSSGIQAIRLNYVEFFLKFFRGGGVPFTPLGAARRYSVQTQAHPRSRPQRGA